VSAVTIWTVGHSTHQGPAFLDLVRGPGVQVVADIRSVPHSRYNPQFNRGALSRAVREAGLGYLFLGAELGGRPPEREMYDGDGRVRYGALARTGRFQAGLQRLLAAAGEHRVAIMCSEEDPRRCHRRLLVGRALTGRGVVLQHIRGDGRVEPESSLPPLPDVSQGVLFGDW
jgi:uncharacterized protein (DUF488 family)